MAASGNPGAGNAADEGAADPGVASALAAFAAGEGSEHAALTALASARLLVPVVAVLTEATDDAEQSGLRREKSSEMALPTLVGNDGRPALLAFSCLDAVRRWRPDARPVPTPAARVWQAAVSEHAAVVIDVAGPVPLAVEGARLAELAKGKPVSPPWRDRDLYLVRKAALAREEALITGCRCRPGEQGADMMIDLTLAPGCGPDQVMVRDAIGRFVDEVVSAGGAMLRRGVAVAVVSPDADDAPGEASWQDRQHDPLAHRRRIPWPRPRRRL
jgi:hypothetical protein